IGTARIAPEARLHILSRTIGQGAVGPDADFRHLGRQQAQWAQHAFDGGNTRLLALLDHRIGDDAALTGVNDARLGSFAAEHLAGYQPDAAGAAMAGAAVMGQVDAVAQRCVQQQLAAARMKAIAVDGNSVTPCHGPSRKAKVPRLRVAQLSRRRGPSSDAQQPERSESETPTLIVDGGTAVFFYRPSPSWS